MGPAAPQAVLRGCLAHREKTSNQVAGGLRNRHSHLHSSVSSVANRTEAGGASQAVLSRRLTILTRPLQRQAFRVSSLQPRCRGATQNGRKGHAARYVRCGSRGLCATPRAPAVRRFPRRLHTPRTVRCSPSRESRCASVSYSVVDTPLQGTWGRIHIAISFPTDI